MIVLMSAVTVDRVQQNSNPPESDRVLFTVIDSQGREVGFKKPIENVMIIGRGHGPTLSVAYMFPSAVEFLDSLSSSLRDATLFNIIDDSIGLKAAKIDTDNVEEVAARAPDVVILKSYMKGVLGDSLESLGINVVYVDLENLDTYNHDLLVLGKIFGYEDKAEDIADYYRDSWSTMLERTGSVEEENRPRVLLLYYSAKGGSVSFKVPGAEWLQTAMIEAAGGYPLSKELPGTGWNTVSFEQIALWNPDIVITVTYSDNPTPSDVKELLTEDPLWSGIEAVDNGMVYAIPDDCGNVFSYGSWDSPSARWVMGLKWMAKIISPELFQDLDLREEARAFYTEMYGLDETEVDLVLSSIQGDVW